MDIFYCTEANVIQGARVYDHSYRDIIERGYSRHSLGFLSCFYLDQRSRVCRYRVHMPSGIGSSSEVQS